MSRHSFFTRLFVFVGALLIVSCSGRSSSNNATTEYYDANFDVPTDDSSYFDQSSSVPGNLFDNTTTADPAPISSTTGSTTTTYQPISSTENQCLTNDNLFFGGIGQPSYYQPTGSSSSSSSYSSPACWRPRDYWQSYWNMGLGMFATQDWCLGQALALDPGPSASANEKIAAVTLAEMVIVRCIRQQYRNAYQYADWNPQQQYSFQNGDQALYQILIDLGKQYPGMN